MAFSIRLRSGKQLHYDHPVVMGIVNLTPDSFYADSRILTSIDEQTEERLLRTRVMNMVRNGAEMIDVGACSTRPASVPVSAQEELHRLEWGLPIVISAIHDARCRRRQMADGLVPEGTWGDNPCKGCPVDDNPFPVSIDTFRASVAEVAVNRLGADIVNDISGGMRDAEMLPLIARTGVPYILGADCNDVATFFHRQLSMINDQLLNSQNQNSLILDPCFGFSKTLDENYTLMHQLPALIAEFKNYPMLVGVSRKSMVYKLLQTDAEHSLNGTTVLHTLALQAGAQILRVHDVPEAVETVKIVGKMTESGE